MLQQYAVTARVRLHSKMPGLQKSTNSMHNPSRRHAAVTDRVATTIRIKADWSCSGYAEHKGRRDTDIVNCQWILRAGTVVIVPRTPAGSNARCKGRIHTTNLYNASGQAVLRLHDICAQTAMQKASAERRRHKCVNGCMTRSSP